MGDTLIPDMYREFIDELVRMCRGGQGQVGAKRVLAGTWNVNATPNFIEDQHTMNILLGRLDASEREVLAKVLANEVRLGVFETLKALEEHGVEPFGEGHEGGPHEDFIGRLEGWEWPREEN